MKPCGLITLLTDFGLADAYAAMLKGVILEINPQARLVDITHQIKPGSIFQAALLLEESFPFFPKGTVHLAVVDPGVGTDRRPIAVQAGDYFFVGPDNGLFWPVIQSCGDPRIVLLAEKKFFHPVSSPTFQGREIFAPVSAHLSCGEKLENLGHLIQDPVKLDLPRTYEQGGFLYGQILRVDRFGNLITNISRKKLEEFLQARTPRIELGEWVFSRIYTAFGDVEPGESLALMDSSGYLAIAVNQGRAVDHLNIDIENIVGMTIKVGLSADEMHD